MSTSALAFKPGFGYFPSLTKKNLSVTTYSKNVSVSVYIIFKKQVVVEWSVPPFYGDCKFNVYVSYTDMNTPSSTWVKLNPSPLTGNYFKDLYSITGETKFLSTFYIVEALLPTGNIIQSDATTFQNKQNSWVSLRAKEINRRETFLLSHFVGVDSVLFSKKTFGKRCHECWDYNIEKVILDNCPSCKGSSFEGGYFEGFRTLLQYEPTPNNADLSYQGAVEPNVIGAWTLSRPVIEVFDIIVRVPDSKAYRVTQVQNTELQTVQIRQILQLTELDRRSIEHTLISPYLNPSYLT